MLPRYKDIVDLLKKGSTIEAQEKIMSLREGALELQEENQELRERIKELEATLKNNNDWATEKDRYALVSPFRGTSSVYALKKSHSNDEIPHFVCTNCFHNKSKVILNQVSKLKSISLVCPVCSSSTDTQFRAIGPAKYAEDYGNEG